MTEYKDKMAKKVVKYWLLTAEKQFMLFVLMGVAFGLYQYFLSVNMSPDKLASTLPTVFIGMGLLALFTFVISGTQVYMPLAISFGSTRKKAFLGYQVASWALVLQIMLACELANQLREKTVLFSNTNDVLYIALILFVLGLGQIGAMIIAKFGNKGMVIIFAIVGGCAGFATCSILAFDFIAVDWLGNRNTTLTGILIGGIIICIIGTALNYKSTLKLCVKW